MPETKDKSLVVSTDGINIEKCREAFEDTYLYAKDYKFPVTNRYSGVYQKMWESWQRCWKHREAEIMMAKGWRP